MAPPPPPPPPLCLPFGRNKPRRLTYDDRERTESFVSDRSSIHRLERSSSYSPTATVTSSKADKLTFHTDSEDYAVEFKNEAREIKPALKRTNTVKEKGPIPKSLPAPEPAASGGGGSKKWYGYGWGVGKKEKEKEREKEEEQTQNLSRNTSHSSRPPKYSSPRPSGGSSSHTKSVSNVSALNPLPETNNHTRSNTMKSTNTQSSSRTARTGQSGNSGLSRRTGASGGSNSRRPGLYQSDSASTLVGSALERKINDVDIIKERPDTGPRLDALRELMKKDSLDY